MGGLDTSIRIYPTTFFSIFRYVEKRFFFKEKALLGHFSSSGWGKIYLI